MQKFTSGLLVIAFLFLLQTSHADNSQAEFVPVNSKLEAALKKKLQQPPPPKTVDITIRRAFWNERYAAAWRLKNSFINQTARDAIAALDDDPESVALYRYRMWSMQGANIKQSLAEAEEQLETPWIGKPLLPPEHRIRLMAFIAGAYIDTWDLPAARKWLDQAQIALEKMKQEKTDPAWQYQAEYQLNAQNRSYKYLFGQSKEALLLAQRNVVIADWFATHKNEISDPLLLAYGDGISVDSRLGLASAYRTMGLLSQATTELYGARAQAIRIGMGGKYRSAIILAAGRLALDRGDFDEAIRHFQYHGEILDRNNYKPITPSQISHRNDLIRTYVAMGNYDAANTLIKQQIEITKGNADARKLAWINPAYTISKFMTGETQFGVREFHRTYLSMLKRYPNNHFYSLRNKAFWKMAQVRSQAKGAAIEEFAETINLMLAAKQRADNSEMDAPNRQYVNLILREYLAGLAKLPAAQQSQKLLDTALRAMDQLRDSVVEESTQAAAARYAETLPGLDKLVRIEQDLRHKIKAGYEQLAAILNQPHPSENTIQALRSSIEQQEVQQKDLLTEIGMYYPGYLAIAYPSPPTAAQIAQKLAADEVFISILPEQKQTYVLAMTANGQMQLHTSQFDQKQIAELVGRLRNSLDISSSLGSTTPVFDNLTANTLYKALIEPTSGMWQDKKHLVISAAGKLGQIPFAVLTRNAQAESYLVRDIAVSHIPSSLSLLAVRQPVTTRASKAFAGFGDPVFTAVATPPQRATRSVRSLQLPRSRKAGDELGSALSNYSLLPPLPETRDEILSIAEVLGADPKTDVYLGIDASRNKVLNAFLGNRRIIAFSTHGLVPGDLPGLTQPALALAKTDKDENPLLLLEDVLGLKLNADWVILSACNTAAADGEASEAISGLGRGFFYAGARALLVTHWAVESESAKQLVTHIFRNYSEPNTSRAAAVQQAQIAMIQSKNYSHPFFWAPYALIGDGR